MIRLFIISPSVAVRAGLRALLIDDQDIQIIGETAYLRDRIWAAEADILVWSPTPALSQERLVPEITDNWTDMDAALLLISDDPKVIEILVKLKIRSWGLVSPESTQAELIAAVKAVNEGLVVSNPVSMTYLSKNHVSGIDENFEMVEPLTGREIEILQLLALGLTNKQIAVRLGISSHTVKFHVSSIFSKMRTTNRTETVKLGLKMGLILL